MATTKQREAGAYKITKARLVKCAECSGWLNPGEHAVTTRVRTTMGMQATTRHAEGEPRCIRSSDGTCNHVFVVGRCVFCPANEAAS